MSHITIPKTHDALRIALIEAEDALNGLEAEGAFTHDDEGMPLFDEDEDKRDLDWIDHNIARLETSLDVITDELNQLIDPEVDEPLTLSELLARYVRSGRVTKEVVETTARLAEGLGGVGSTVGPGLGISDFDADSLGAVLDSIRNLVDYLKTESPSP
jgi:hypothetical protein